MKKVAQSKHHVFLVGAKSIGFYGGFETFIAKLIEEHQDDDSIQYYVACKANGQGCMREDLLQGVETISDSEFWYKGAYCFKLQVPQIGAAQAIYYDVKSLEYCCQYIKEHKIENPIVYVMACRIGPFMAHYKRKIKKLGGTLLLNPDGHEWMRGKWNKAIKMYWKWSERLMIKQADISVCDSKCIEEYVKDTYRRYHPKTTFIAYGANVLDKAPLTEKYLTWCEQNGLQPGAYYMSCGRFVQENNYELIIREYMASKTTKSFVLITNVNQEYLQLIHERTGFKDDSRIKIMDAIYDRELLRQIRENAYAYIHGHEVGGTNPSLLEALSCTKLNLLYEVGFNVEVAKEAAKYWNKETGNLAKLLEEADEMTDEQLLAYETKAKNRIKEAYSWPAIAARYKEVYEDIASSK